MSLTTEVVEKNVSQASRALKPKEIIVFHDGVNERQFDMVLNKELSDLKSVPKIMLVVAQKRHQTQLFLENMADGGPHEICLQELSHYGRIGTRNCQEHFVQLDGYFSPSHVSKASGWRNLLLIYDPFA
ncbi:hypothetical protein CDL12_29832 [Handroanthus impetiginosus]|uniref:Piwi domain-containing protein n=1 Tax=Handroanthus impetiginosus TaxID=429701 RepID=A0A2G9FXA9_9LAMI|nr:hypothetical protein CDL12_29832 [Handroanthus impetiginosus]